jgi:L-ascorbate metabolism protein UlaG (beta-lactamase superfamily)
MFYATSSFSHNKEASAKYLGNEGVLVTMGQQKILFDPFFHNGFNHYTLVPKELRTAIFNNVSPFDDISAIFVSHAHGDHFDAKDVAQYLKTYPKVQLYAPQQAIEKLQELPIFTAIKKQTTAISLNREDSAWSKQIESLTIEAIRIPHAGWPARAEVENLLFRVTGGHSYTVMHLGDSDTSRQFYLPHQTFFNKKKTDMAFVPYWFYGSDASQKILSEFIKADQTIGVHVPTIVPEPLKNQTKFDYFSKPGEERKIKNIQKK